MYRAWASQSDNNSFSFAVGRHKGDFHKTGNRLLGNLYAISAANSFRIRMQTSLLSFETVENTASESSDSTNKSNGFNRYFSKFTLTIAFPARDTNIARYGRFSGYPRYSSGRCSVNVISVSCFEEKILAIISVYTAKLAIHYIISILLFSKVVIIFILLPRISLSEALTLHRIGESDLAE